MPDAALQCSRPWLAHAAVSCIRPAAPPSTSAQPGKQSKARSRPTAKRGTRHKVKGVEVGIQCVLPWASFSLLPPPAAIPEGQPVAEGMPIVVSGTPVAELPIEAVPSDARELTITDCPKLIALPGMQRLYLVIHLEISVCPSLEVVPPSVGRLSSLQTLIISDCPKLTALPELRSLKVLVSLDLSGCTALTALDPSLGRLPRLQTLRLAGCRSLTALPPLEDLPSIISIDLSLCVKLNTLPPSLGKLRTLEVLRLERCEGLAVLPPLDGLVRSSRSTSPFASSSSTSPLRSRRSNCWSRSTSVTAKASRRCPLWRAWARCKLSTCAPAPSYLRCQSPAAAVPSTVS